MRVADDITKGKVRETLCFCEHKGMPLVVHMANGECLMAYAGASANAVKYVEKLAMVEETVLRQAASPSLSEGCNTMEMSRAAAEGSIMDSRLLKAWW